jgi:hypothetical protein
MFEIMGSMSDFSLCVLWRGLISLLRGFCRGIRNNRFLEAEKTAAV